MVATADGVDRSESYASSPTKRARRTKAAIGRLTDEILAVLEDRPMTVRQVFYQLVSRGAIAKSEAEYKGTVCRLLANMRRDGTIPYDWLSDNTRWMRKPDTYSSLMQGLRTMQHWYRRDLWAELDVYVEVWLEKEALAGVLCQVTEEWDVPLMVTRGYPSLSFLHSAGETIRDIGKPTHLYYFGDRDPSGVDIPRVVEASIREFAPKVELHFEVVAVTEEQIEAMSLPTRPTKKTDTRSKSFRGESVEVDAIKSSTLKHLCEYEILGHIDQERLERLRTVEAAEKQTLGGIIRQIGGVA